VLLLARPRGESTGAAEGAGQRRPSGGASGSRAGGQLLSDVEAAAVALESLNHPQDRFLKFALDQTMDTLKPFVR
jgi:hypothetical protein